jgi:hypothetical protein
MSYAVAKEVFVQEMDDTIVLLDLSTGNYFQIWE